MTEAANELRDKMLEDFQKQPLQFMKEERIKYTESIETIMPNGLKRWIKIKVSGKGFTIEQAAMDAKTKFDKALSVVSHLSTPSAEYPSEIQQAPPVIDRAKETLKEIINDCETEGELANHKYSAEKYGLQDEYEKRRQEIISKKREEHLSNQQLKQLS